MIDSFLYAQMLPHLKRSNNLACHKYSAYDHTVAHAEQELKLGEIQNETILPIPTTTVTMTR